MDNRIYEEQVYLAQLALCESAVFSGGYYCLFYAENRQLYADVGFDEARDEFEIRTYKYNDWGSIRGGTVLQHAEEWMN